MAEMASYRDYIIRINPKDKSALQFQQSSSSQWLPFSFPNAFTTNHTIIDIIVSGNRLLITEIGNGYKQTHQTDLRIDGNRLCGSSRLPVSGTYEKIDKTDENPSILVNMISKTINESIDESNKHTKSSADDNEQEASERELKYQKEEEEKQRREEAERIERLTCPYCNENTDMETNIYKYEHFFHSECIKPFEDSDSGKVWIKNYNNRKDEQRKRRNRLNDIWISQTKEGEAFAANTNFKDEEDKQAKISVERKNFEENLDRLKTDCRTRKIKLEQEYDHFSRTFNNYFDNYDKTKVDNWISERLSKYNYSYSSPFRSADILNKEERDYSIPNTEDLDAVSELLTKKFDKLPKKYSLLFSFLRICIDFCLALNGIVLGIYSIKNTPIKSVFYFVLSACFIVSPFVGKYFNNKKRITVSEKNVSLLEETIK